MTGDTTLIIPPELLPRDGRFGSGPSKVRPEQIEALVAAGSSLLGTSHRADPVRSLVGRVRAGIAALYDLPEGHEVVLGNGGSTAFWDVATFSLVERLASHAVCGEFGAKFAAATSRAPFLDDSLVAHAPYGSATVTRAEESVDVYAWTHNETSTGVTDPMRRQSGEPWVSPASITVVDGTSAAGAIPFDLAVADVYYFAPQKVFGADGGLWLALLAPAAVERAERLAQQRWIPEFLDLSVALANSRADQTLNTPALATLVLLAEQVEWLLEQGGLSWAAARSGESAAHVYGWAEEREWARPFVSQPPLRSPVVATVDIDESIDATEILAVLRRHGVVDVFPYRKLGRNQLRIGMFPSVDPDDVRALTACVDFVVERL